MDVRPVTVSISLIGISLAGGSVLLTTPVAAQIPAGGKPDEIVVTASSMPLEAVKVGSAVSVITAEDLDLQGIRYAADALQHVPGIAVNRLGSFGGQTQIRLRGAEGNHVLVMIDGVEVPAASSGEFDVSSLLADGIERIEVLRGPQSGLYGANAMAGVINVITRDGADGTGAEVSLEAGAFDSVQVGLGARGGSERRSGALTLGYRDTDGVNTAQIGDEADGDENLTLIGRGNLNRSDVLSLSGSFRLTDKHTETDGFDFTGGPNQGLAVDDDSYTDTVDAQVAGSATWTLRDGDLVTRVSGWLYDSELDGETYRYVGGREQLRVMTTARLDDNAGIAQFITGFVEHEEESFRNAIPFDPSQVPELDRSILGVGLEYRAELGDRLYLSGAIRRDDNEGFDDATTYRVTAAYQLAETGTRLHASFGVGVTNPTFFDQFGFVPGTYVGNPDLRPEKSDGWDVGIEQSFADGRMAIDVTWFDADLEDEIISVFPSVVNQSGASQRDGVEVALSGQPTDRITVAAAFTYTDASDPDGTEEVRRPPRTASLDVAYRTAGDRGTIYAGVIYNGRMLDTDFRNYFANGFVAEKSPVDAFTLVNIGGYFDITERLQVFGRVDNLLDEDYQASIGYNTPGRAAYAGIRYRFDRD
jgi:vitamin B12 transporter